MLTKLFILYEGQFRPTNQDATELSEGKLQGCKLSVDSLAHTGGGKGGVPCSLACQVTIGWFNDVQRVICFDSQSMLTV